MSQSSRGSRGSRRRRRPRPAVAVPSLKILAAQAAAAEHPLRRWDQHDELPVSVAREVAAQDCVVVSASSTWNDLVVHSVYSLEAEPLRVIARPSNRNWINCFARVPGQPWVLVADNSADICVWDVVQRKKVRVLTGHIGFVLSVLALSCVRAVSCGEDKAILFWSLVTSQPVARVSAHQDTIWRLVGLGSRLFASCSDDTTVQVFQDGRQQGDSPERVLILQHRAPVQAMTVLLRGTGAGDGRDADGTGPGERIDIAAGTRLITGDDRGRIRVFTSPSFTRTQMFRPSRSPIYELAGVSDDALAFASGDGVVRIISLTTSQRIATLRPPDAVAGPVTQLVPLPMSRDLAVATMAGVRVWRNCAGSGLSSREDRDDSSTQPRVVCSLSGAAKHLVVLQNPFDL